MTDQTTPDSAPPAGGNETPWYSTVADPDLRGFAELKGFKTLDDQIKSHRELEKFVGAPKDRLLMLPEKADDPAWAAIKSRVAPEFAVPEDVGEYKLPVPEGFDGAFANEAATWFKDAGIPPSMAAKLTEKWNGWTAAQIAAQDAALERGVTEAQAALKAEWGARYEETMVLAQRAETAMAADLGVDVLELKAMMDAAPRAYYKLLAAQGGTMREDTRHDGGNTPGHQKLSPEAAKVRYDQLRADPAFREKYLKNDSAAVAEINHLLTMMQTR